MSDAAVVGRAAPDPGNARRAALAGVGLLAAVVLIAFGFTLNGYYSNVAVLTFLSVILAVSLRLLMLAGEASLCHGAFYAFGAYTAAILSTQHGVPFWLTVPLGGLVAVVGAIVIGIPSLRASGSYFLLMTFGFLIVAVSVMEFWTGLTGGFSGISGIPAPPGIDSSTAWYFAALILALITIAVFFAIERSRWGLELRAMGESRDLGQSVGIAPKVSMLTAFCVGAFFAGVAGTFYAGYMTFISPSSFSFWLSVYVMMYVIVGGRGYLVGAIVGALVLSVLPLLADWSASYVSIFTAAATLVILLLAPRGIVPSMVRRAEGTRFEGRPALRSTAVRPAAAPAAMSERQAWSAQSTATSPLLRVEGVSKRFGGLQALDGVTFEVAAHERLGIIGPNGAGKTTLFNVISGFDRPSGGSVSFAGRSITGASPSQIVALGLTRTFQSSSVFEGLTVFENLVVGCRGDRRPAVARGLVPVTRDTRPLAQARELLDRFDLTRWSETRAGALPYGVRKRLGVAIGMATEPQMLFLDEPMAGLADREVEEMSSLLADLRAKHDTTIVLIEHRMAAVMELCDRLLVLEFGRVIADGVPRDVVANPAVVEAYLGADPEELEHV